MVRFDFSKIIRELSNENNYAIKRRIVVKNCVRNHLKKFLIESCGILH